MTYAVVLSVSRERPRRKRTRGLLTIHAQRLLVSSLSIMRRSTPGGRGNKALVGQSTNAGFKKIC